MKLKADQERVKNLLLDTVTLLCKNGLAFNKELKVQGLLGITLDDKDVFVVHFNENFAEQSQGATVNTSLPTLNEVPIKPKLPRGRPKKRPSLKVEQSTDISPSKKKKSSAHITSNNKSPLGDNEVNNHESVNNNGDTSDTSPHTLLGEVVVKSEPIYDDNNIGYMNPDGPHIYDDDDDNATNNSLTLADIDSGNPYQQNSDESVLSQTPHNQGPVIETVETVQGDKLALWDTTVVRKDGETVPVSVISSHDSNTDTSLTDTTPKGLQTSYTPPRWNYDNDNMRHAYNAVIENGWPVARAARHFNVPRRTLRDRLEKKCQASRIRFNQTEEMKIVESVKVIYQSGLPVGRKDVLDIAQQYGASIAKFSVDQTLSPVWYKSFVSRWPELKDIVCHGSLKNVSNDSTNEGDVSFFS